MKHHSFPIRVYYEDTDAGGIVYHASYLKFAERARTEWLRSLGFEQQLMMDEQDVAFVVRHLDIEFLRSARLDDVLTIDSSLHDITRATITMNQTVRRGAEILCQLCVKLAAVCPSNGRLSRIPPPVLDALNRHKHKE